MSRVTVFRGVLCLATTPCGLCCGVVVEGADGVFIAGVLPRRLPRTTPHHCLLLRRQAHTQHICCPCCPSSIQVMALFFHMHSRFDWSKYCWCIEGPRRLDTLHSNSRLDAGGQDGDSFGNVAEAFGGLAGHPAPLLLSQVGCDCGLSWGPFSPRCFLRP